MKNISVFMIVFLVSSISVLANPILVGIGAKTVLEGDTLTFNVANSAPNNGSAFYMLNSTTPISGVSTLSVLGNPATLSRLSDTAAEFSWTAPSVAADTIVLLDLSVSDLDSSDNEIVAIVVQNKPIGPTLSVITPKTVNEQGLLSFTVSCSEPDNGDSVFSLLDTGIGTITKVSNTQALFQFTAPPVTQDTILTQTVRVQDADSESTMTFTITVKDMIGGLTVTDIKFGGSSTARSNADRNIDSYVNAQFTIRNNDPIAATNLQVAWPSAAKYNITFVSSTLQGTSTASGYSWDSLGAGDSVTVTLRARIPDDLSSFFQERTNPNADRTVDIGDLLVSSLGFSPVQADVLMEAENNLIIYRLYVQIGDKTERRYDDGSEITDIEPGSKVTIRLEAENRFSTSSRVTIDDVEMNFFADDGDFDEDRDRNIGRITAGNRREGTITFTLDDELEDDSYNTRITLLGIDSNRAMHGEVHEIRFRVEREDENLEIVRLDLEKEEISLCDERSTTLRVVIRNNGQFDADEAVLVVQNRALGILSRTLNIQLDTLESYTRTFTLNFPADATEGIYQIEAMTYFDRDQYDDGTINTYGSVPIKLVKCATPVTPTTPTTPPTNNQGGDVTDRDEVVVIIDKEPTIPGGQEAIAVPVAPKTDRRDTLYMMLLILGYLVVIAVIIKLVISLLRK